MRKLWVLSALVLFMALPASAEKYLACKKKCSEITKHPTNLAMCQYCCEDRMEKARNACGLKALQNLGACQEKAKTDKEMAKCDATFAKEASPCFGAKDIDISNEECSKK